MNKNAFKKLLTVEKVINEINNSVLKNTFILTLIISFA